LKKSTYGPYIIVLAVLVTVDQISKYIVATNMEVGQRIPLIGDVFSIRYLVNFGMSFSMLQDRPQLVIALQLVIFIVAAFAFRSMARDSRSKVMLTGFSMIMAGGIGNIIDRFARGHVVDFFSVGSFPVWNVADMCIIGGCAFVGIALFIEGRNRAKLKKRHRLEPSDTGAPQ
jgi:signal peptidase II